MFSLLSGHVAIKRWQPGVKGAGGASGLLQGGARSPPPVTRGPLISQSPGPAHGTRMPVPSVPLGTGPPLCPQTQTGLRPRCLSTDQMSTWPGAQRTSRGPQVKAEGGHRSIRSAPARPHPPHLTPRRPQDVGGTACCYPPPAPGPEVGLGLRHTKSWSKVTSLHGRPRVRGQEPSPACTAREAQQVAAQPRTCRQRGGGPGCTGCPLLGPHRPCDPATRAGQGLTEPGCRDQPILGQAAGSLSTH